jgi:hypothetical protein
LNPPDDAVAGEVLKPNAGVHQFQFVGIDFFWQVGGHF